MRQVQKKFPTFRRDLAFIIEYTVNEILDEDTMDMCAELYSADFRNSEFARRKPERLYSNAETFLSTFWGAE